ncbi:MAG TPA: TonB-dependent receptor [Vicinamibacterales bacterium]|nr:TonB-dependent receptor [Vicinamibacterales bacterium]
MTRRIAQALLALVAVGWLSVDSGLAQTTGTTGSITGKVIDASGGVLPGVTVTVSSPSLLGVQTSVTDSGGSYRFPALPPGVFSVTYELAGFRTLKREDIRVSLNFTATLNVSLEVAALQETVTVTGDSPVIDATSTRVQQTFTLKEMSEIPNARQMWSLIAATPSVTMARTDVGGSQAGTQGNYTAYGFNGQRQVVMEGINVTYDASLSAFYPDYGSLEEVSVGTISHGAEAANPGTQTQMLTKSGGNRLSGEVFQDYGNNSMQGANIPDNVLAQGIREHSNEWVISRNFHANGGGPAKKDKIWWHVAYHNQKSAIEQPNFIGSMTGVTYDTFMYNFTGKVTGQLNKSNKLIGYFSRNQLLQRPVPTFTFTSEIGTTADRENLVRVAKVEWNGTLSNNLYAEARFGGVNLYSSNLAQTDTRAFLVVDSALGTATGGERKRQYTPQRRQIEATLSYFKDAWGGSHTFKIGGGALPELRNDGYTQLASGNVRQNMNNGAPVSVVLDVPTAVKVSQQAGNVDKGDLTTLDRLKVYSAYASDQWQVGRLTMNLGLRWDRYHAWSPEQEQHAYSFGPLNVPELTFPEQDYFTWNKVVPRIGGTYDLAGNGKTVVKVNYSLFAFNPGISLGGFANKNQLQKTVTYAWADNRVCPGCIAGDGIYQPGEAGNLLASSLSNSIQIDPNLKQPTSTQATAFLERQLTQDLGGRVGFVYYTVKNQVAQYQAFRPPSAYTVPFTIVDRGADNILGSSDDRNLTYYGIPNALIGTYPTTTVVMSIPNNGTYKSMEVTLSKRRGQNWSLSSGFGYTWIHDYPAGFPNTANGPFDEDRRLYSLKASGTYTLPWNILLSAAYQFQSGANYARTLAVSAPASCACTFTSAGIAVTPYNEFAYDNVSLFDLRVEKTIDLGPVAKLRVFLDGFNLANSYAAEIVSAATGPTFQRPTAILAPRTAKVGFRVSW